MTEQPLIPDNILTQFKQLLEEMIPVPEQLWAVLPMFASYCQFEEREILHEEDLVNPKAYFLAKGLCRSFVSVYDKEVTVSFYERNNIFTSFNTDFEHTGSVNYFEFLEPTQTIAIRYKELTELAQQHRRIDRYYRIIIENQIINKYRDIKYHLKYNASEKYQRLVEEKPEWIQRIPQKHIASYLGVTPQSLSRIRKGLVG